ncbi:MAG: type VI secretion protein IcmF/TssM N-terminal domain-containing protein [Pedobacter sp.]
MRTLLKYVLFVTLVLLVLLLVVGLVLVLDWPWWVGGFILLCIVGLCFGGFFLKKILLRRKEQKFVQQVIADDESHLKKLQGKERDEYQDLQNRWKEAVDTLRGSHLKKQGNPLYVLPWYLVMGESGSGKTTAITSAKLSSPFVEVTRTSGVSGTRNCDWWFFEQAIVIDTAGRFAIPVDEGRDKDEWQKFLSLLVKYRKREPIHGLIVTVSADKLAKGSTEELEEDGRTIRRRIDELMRVLGIKFPVYLLVTKCDLVQGMTQFTDMLPEKSLEQPMGAVNQDLSKDVPGFLDRVISGIGERLRNIRLLLLQQSQGKELKTGVLLFPEEFENLKKGLSAFAKYSFQENPFQETPILRGIYFSSGRQEGTPYSHFLGALGLIGERDVLPGTSNGLFLHDFFASILPGDRGLFAPTTRALEWQVITRNLGLTAWVFLWIAAAGIMSFSFVNNLATIRVASHEFSKPPALSGEMTTDLVTMDQYRKMIHKVETRNSNWWVPRFGLNESRKVEAGLKERYCRLFQDRFMTPLDKGVDETMAGFNAATSDDMVAPYVVHLARRINLLKTRLDNGAPEALRAKPLPSYVARTSGQGVDAETGKKFGDLYISALLWRTDTAEMTKELSVLQTWYKHLLALRAGNLQWLVSWANRQGDAPPITMQSFWGGSLPLQGEKIVAPAFTKKGKEMINGMLTEMISAQPQPELLEKPKSSFEEWYRRSCFAAWREFAAQFPRGVERLKGENEWQAVAVKMGTDQDPYSAFIYKLTSELEPLTGTDDMPLWLQQVYRFQIIKTKGAAGAIVSKTTEEGKKLVGKLEQVLGKKSQVSSSLESQSVAYKAVQDYQKALGAAAQGTASRNQAYQLALVAYGEEAEKSPFNAVFGAAARLKANIGGGQADDAFSRLIQGPGDFLWAFVRKETACSLQSQWEEKVLQEAQGAVDPQVVEYLVGQEGPVWKFVNGPAKPFLGWGAGKGYYAKVALGGAVDFDPIFYSFLSKGAKAKVAAVPKQNFNVTIRGLPTDANPEARVKPQSTRLELQCASGAQSLENLNYPTQKTFNWTPDGCSDVLFQIEAGEAVLTKKYSGPQAFPAFLEDFPGGRRTFYATEFPAQKLALDRMGIKYIKVNYQISGQQSVVGKAKSIPGRIPGSIARCWN